MSFDPKQKTSGRDFLFSVLWHLSCTIRSCTIRLHYISLLRQCEGRHTTVIVFKDVVYSFPSMFLDFPSEFCSVVRSVCFVSRRDAARVYLNCLESCLLLLVLHYVNLSTIWMDRRRQKVAWKLVNGFVKALGHAASLLQWPQPEQNANMVNTTCRECYNTTKQSKNQTFFASHYVLCVGPLHILWILPRNNWMDPISSCALPTTRVRIGKRITTHSEYPYRLALQFF